MREQHFHPLIAALSTALSLGISAHAWTQESGVATIVVTERALQGEVELTPGGVTSCLVPTSCASATLSSLADLLRYAPGVWAAKRLRYR